MDRRRALAFVFALACAAPHLRAQASLAEELERLVDLPSAAERKQAARGLAERCAARVGELEAAARAFGRFEPLAIGVQELKVELRVGAQNEATELSLYVPASYTTERAAPLLLAFHGTGGRGRELLGMWRRFAEECGMLVLAPTEAGPNVGYRFSERERLAALAALRWVRRRANVDENRIFATGISRGGHLAWDLALRFPDVFAGLAPMIGGPRITLQDGQNNLRYCENVVGLAIRDLQGAKDDPALVWSVQTIFDKLRRLNALDAQLVLQEDHGHSFDIDAVDWAAFFSSKRRDPRPARVVRASARKHEGRAFWVEVLEPGPNVKEDFTPKVSAAGWASKSEDEKRLYLIAEAEKRTARLQVERGGAGRYSATSTSVKRWRILLEAQDLDGKQELVVTWNGDSSKQRPRPSAFVLLEEFAERFDRTFVPVAELQLR
jgi:dienelactone hydrolase